MLDKLKLLLLLCIIILVCFSKTAHSKEIVIGETVLQIPAPKGCIDISSVSKEHIEFLEPFVPEANRLQAVFIRRQDAGLLLHGKSFNIEETFQVQSAKKLDGQTFSKAQFAVVSKSLQEGMEKLSQNYRTLLDKETTKAKQRLSKKLDEKVELNISDVIYLGIDEESASHFTATSLAKKNLSIAGESYEYLYVSTVTCLLIKGKIIYLYVFRGYKGDEDIALARSKTKAWLSSIRSANNMKCELADGRLVPKNVSIDSQTQKLISGEKAVYSLIGHPKARGLKISLEYPSSWQAKEGILPNVIQMFTGESVSQIIPSFLLVVNEMPAGGAFLKSDRIPDEIIKEALPPGADFIDSGHTKLDGEPAAWLKCYSEQEQAGFKVGGYHLNYILLYQGKILIVQCSVGGPADKRELIKDAFESHLPLFQLIGNSILIHEKWDQPASNESDIAILDDFDAARWGALIESFIMALIIGLIPPLIIRFLIYHKPMPISAAIGFAVLLWFINIIIFIPLGMEFETLVALILAGISSYAILHRGYSNTAEAAGSTLLDSDSNPLNKNTNFEKFEIVNKHNSVLIDVSSSATENMISKHSTQNSDAESTMLIHEAPENNPQQGISLEETNEILHNEDLDSDETACQTVPSDYTAFREMEGGEISPPPLPNPGSKEDRLKKAPTTDSLHPWRRYFARIFDTFLFGIIVTILLVFLIISGYVRYNSQLAYALGNTIVNGILIHILWLPFEAMFLSLIGTTPAKWIFGIRILDFRGDHLSIGKALQRTLLVWTQGLCLGIPLLLMITQISAYYKLKRTGKTLWDDSLNTVVTHRPWSIFRIICCVVVVIVFLLLHILLKDISKHY